MITTASGLRYEELAEGAGAEAKSGDSVRRPLHRLPDRRHQVRQQPRPQQPVRLQARRRPRHQGLGRGRRRHEGGRQAQAAHPAAARLRRPRRRRRDPAQRRAGLRGRAAVGEVSDAAGSSPPIVRGSRPGLLAAAPLGLGRGGRRTASTAGSALRAPTGRKPIDRAVSPGQSSPILSLILRRGRRGRASRRQGIPAGNDSRLLIAASEG